MTPRRSAEREITNYFHTAPRKVYSQAHIASVLRDHRQTWHLPAGLTSEEFTGFLLEKTKFRRVKLQSDSYGCILRYTWGVTTPYQLALSLRSNAYLSHATAVFLHGLADRAPNTIYVNKEQSPKEGGLGELTQKAIDSAFARAQRVSNYVFRYEKNRIVLISGKYTGRLEVGRLLTTEGEQVDVTRVDAP